MYVQDEAGNEEVSHIVINNIDRTPPELNLTLDSDPARWTNRPVNVYVQADDNSGEIKALRWSEGHQTVSYFQDGHGTPFHHFFTITQNSTYSIYAEDQAGNGAVQTFDVSNIDTDLPVIHLSYDPEQWTNRSVTVSADVYDATSEITQRKWTVGDQPIAYFEAGGTPFDAAFEVELNGIYTVFAEDAAGNRQIKTVNITNIFNETPVVQLTMFPTAPTQDKVTVTASVYSQLDLAVKKIALGWHDVAYFQTEGEPWVEEFSMEDNGWLSYYVRDEAGNETVKRIQITQIDREIPIITLIGGENIRIVQGTEFIDPGATAQDQQDGDLTEKIIVSGEVNTQIVGEYKLIYQVEDRAGNAAEEAIRIVTVIPRSSSGGGGGNPGDNHPGSNNPVGGGGSSPENEVVSRQPEVEQEPGSPELSCSEYRSECGTEDEWLFSDIEGHWAWKEISELAREQLIQGYPDGSFKPDHLITKAEFATLVVSSLGLEPIQESLFQDTIGHWASGSIAAEKKERNH